MRSEANHYRSRLIVDLLDHRSDVEERSHSTSEDSNMMAPWFTIATYLMSECGAEEQRHLPRASLFRFPSWRTERRDDQSIVKMFEIAGIPYGREDEAWCLAFIGACLRLAGFANSQSLQASDYGDFGEPISVPQPGCLVVLAPNADGASAHVGFFDHQFEDAIYVLSGNPGRTIGLRKARADEVRIYRWPTEPAPLPSDPYPLVTIRDITRAGTPFEPRGNAIDRDDTRPVNGVHSISGEDNFGRVQAVIDRLEDGFVANPDLPGGASNMGISRTVLSQWRARPVTFDDLRTLTRDEAHQIYRAVYWNKIAGEQLPVALALMTYNLAVLANPAKGLTVLQRALNAQGASLTADGGPSAATFAAATGADPVATIEEFARIEEGCHQASGKSQYLSGWLERLAEVKAVALSWTPEVPQEEETKSPSPEEIPDVLVKALQRDLSKRGYFTGAVDGKFGTLTSAALLGFQHDRSLPPTGVPDPATTAALGENWQRPLSQDRVTATADDLRTLGSQTITAADNTKLVALVSTVLGALGLGNSTVVQVASSQGGVGAAAKSVPSQAPSLIELLNQLEFLLRHPTDKAAIAKIPQLRDYVAQLVNNDWSNLSSAAISQTTQQLNQLNQQLSHLKPPVDLQSLIDQIDFLSRCSAPDTFVSVLANLGPTCAQGLANAGTGPSLISGLDMLTNSMLPGFGGALLTLAIGLSARYFSNQAIQSRVQDHQTGRNLGR